MGRLTEKRKAAVEPMMKEAIYEAAVKILLMYGLNGLTMDRVAETAEMAKGTLYNYFKDKKSLQLYIFAKVSEPFMQQMSNIRRDTISPREKLEQVVEVMFHRFEENRQILNILAEGRIHNLKKYSMQLAKIPELSDGEIAKEPIEKVIESIVLEGVQSGQFYAFDPQLATNFILGALTAMIDRQIQNGQGRAVEKNIAQLVRFLMGGLTNVSSASAITDTGGPKNE